MPKFSPILAALLAAAPAAFADVTALDAMKLLPQGAAARLARIEACEGQPAPGRWHLLVHDPKEESGLHEYVVAGGEIVASRSISQFAESLSSEDVIGAAVKVDSDRAARLAQQYAQANQLTIASLDYELKKSGDDAAPLWRVTCIGPEGKPFGHIMVTATRGTVVAHDGFPTEPASSVEKIEKPRAVPASQIARTTAPEKEKEKEKVKEKKTEQRSTEVALRTQRETERSRETERAPVAPAVPVAPEPEAAPAAEEEAPRESRPGFFRRVGGSLQKVVTGRDTIGR